jgi:hypothetical protein
VGGLAQVRHDEAEEIRRGEREVSSPETSSAPQARVAAKRSCAVPSIQEWLLMPPELPTPRRKPRPAKPCEYLRRECMRRRNRRRKPSASPHSCHDSQDCAEGSDVSPVVASLADAPAPAVASTTGQPAVVARAASAAVSADFPPVERSGSFRGSEQVCVTDICNQRIRGHSADLASAGELLQILRARSPLRLNPTRTAPALVGRSQ